ncbi:MAG TPA: sigma-70 family RNA polymerase sigma factor [Pyrinomonadaceae bacterium]|nr:sigma-70 family RNA polymerase sigma factor [Pyrinomonadaceae bacterium]
MPDSAITTGFEKLLNLLDENRENAGLKYESLRRRLIKFFDWRNCFNSEDLTDEVFERIVKKLSEGEVIQNINAYAATVAQFVFKEYCRRKELKNQSIDENPQFEQLESKEKFAEKFEETEDVRQICFANCLQKMDAETRNLLIAYHDTDEATMISARKRLAESLGMNLNTLRIKICRQKTKLEDCTKKCCAEKN